MREIAYKTVGGRTLYLRVLPPGDPGGGQAAVAVFFHGGGWVRGSWEQFVPQAELLNALGMVTVLVEYRLDGPVVAAADAVDAMNAVFELAADLGGDPARVVAVGGSAGGQLALATAVLELPGSVPEYRPAAVALLNPVTDTTGDFPKGFGRRHFEDDDQALMYSPVHHVSATTPPSILLHGTADTAVHHENSIRFADAVNAVGGQAEIVLYDGQKHGFFNAHKSREYFELTTQEIIGFLRRTVLQSS
ncbi:alpha/beta hydrolase [Kribbella amoyensis]|uniref:alpha/beta hydrolase n=1 Tax=Kribbella amoyensis TaxID=996641 RepID=UPI00147808F3|nr:alpha/beta hydrolase [Kribbella amoyensis]